MANTAGLTAILMWGLLALLGANSAEIPAFQLLFICFSIAFGLMLARRVLRGNALWQKPDLSISQWLIGTLGLFGFHFLYFWALKLAPALQVSLIVYLWPLLLTILVARSGQRLQAIVGGGLGFAGVCLLLASKGNLDLQADHLTGYALAAGCALIWAGYSFWLARTPGKSDHIGWVAGLSALLALISHLLLEPMRWHYETSVWLSALLLGLGPVGGAFFLWDYALKRGNQVLLGALSFCAPLISALALVISGTATYSPVIVVALSLVLTGGLIASPPEGLKHLFSRFGRATAGKRISG